MSHRHDHSKSSKDIKKFRPGTSGDQKWEFGQPVVLDGDGKIRHVILSGSFPVDDTTPLVRDPTDRTRTLRLDVGAVSTATTRVIIMPDSNVDLSSGGSFSDLTATVLRDGSQALSADWDNTGRRIRNTGVAEVQASEPTSPVKGELWLDTDASSGGSSVSVFAQKTVTADYTLLTTDVFLFCDATAGGFTVTLPPSAANAGRVYHVQKIDATANVVTIDGDGSETINGSLTVPMSIPDTSRSLVSNASNWRIF